MSIGMPKSEDTNQQVVQAINERRWSDAQSLLENTIVCMPSGWSPVQQNASSTKMAFWDQEEFFVFVSSQDDNEKSILWKVPSYSMAWWLLAVVKSEQGELNNAILCLEHGIGIEPDHPKLWIEKGFILNRIKRHQEALECYTHAALVRDWAPKSQIARALRGRGASLIDLGNLDEAEIAYRNALQMEPENANAQKELDYIAKARQEKERTQDKVPWFLESLIHPPTDPLTIQFVALVEDLQPIPGPRTVGPENYSRVMNAFISKGWAGFEEAFDIVVPWTRSDYADVKRDLLREPIFNRRTHLNMARVILGKATIEEVWGEIARRKDSAKLQ